MLSTMPEFLNITPAFINLGVPELSIIVLLVLIFFGPGKLPSIMKSLGDGVKQFKDASNGNPAQPNSTEPNPADTKHLS